MKNKLDIQSFKFDKRDFNVTQVSEWLERNKIKRNVSPKKSFIGDTAKYYIYELFKRDNKKHKYKTKLMDNVKITYINEFL